MTATAPCRNGLAPAPVDPAPATRVNGGTRWQRRYSHLLRITDSAIVCASVMFAQYVRFGDVPHESGYPGRVMTFFSCVFVALWLSHLAIFNARSIHIVGVGIDEYRRIVSASFWTFGIIAMVTLLAKIYLARGYLAVALPFGTLALLISRYLWRIYIRRQRAHGKYQIIVLAIGNRRAVAHLAHELTRDPKQGYVVAGLCIPGYGPPRGGTLTIRGYQIPILGDESYAASAAVAYGADTVAITGPEHIGVQGFRELTWQLETTDVDLVVAPGVIDVAETRLALRPVAGFPLLHVEKPQYEGAQRFQKRAFDFCFSLAALLGTLPLFLLAAVGIKLTSKGPIFYRSERVGLDGKPFTMLKFRTMVDGADAQIDHLLPFNESTGNVLFKMRQDPRITPFGKILRRFSIDELPQFINVLKEDMSVVGPRPPLRREVENYDGDVMRRLLVKPGVTGLWQVSGRSDLSWEDSVRLDLSYVDNWSMTGDLLLIARTLKAVLTSNGAY